ncbi:MAG: ParB/RepB/Spo0J family partition protein [Candidatus Sedimenticola sp. (ex Thyasira tokunagai)]
METTDKLAQIDIASIRRGRYQPRRNFPPETLEELANSIRASGVIQPVIVRPVSAVSDQFELIAGERRWRAAQLAGLDSLPCIIRVIDEQVVAKQALIENIQREALNPIEEALGIQRLIDEFELRQQDVARQLGCSRTRVTHLLRLLKLHHDVRSMIEQRSLSFGHAKCLAGLPHKQQHLLAQDTVTKCWSVRQLEQQVHALNSTSENNINESRRDPNIVKLENDLSAHVGAPTSLSYIADKQTGRLNFQFHSLDELEGILEHLGFSTTT